MPAAGPVPAGMRGIWAGNVTVSPLGPMDSTLSFGQFLTVSEPDEEGNVFLLHPMVDQLMRVQGTLMQYCFGYENPRGAEEAPFVVAPADSENELKFCWRGERLPSHPTGCSGCQCAQWILRLNGDTLHSEMQMPPPVIHMQLDLTRSGPAPSAEQAFNSTRAKIPCQFDNFTGNPLRGSYRELKQPRTSCSDRRPAIVQERPPALSSYRTALQETVQGAGVGDCVLLNRKHNVRFRYRASQVLCMPCKVTFEISVDTPATSTGTPYLAAALKGRNLAYQEGAAEEPNYWGMAASGVTLNTTNLSSRIVLGYVGKSSCLRQLEAPTFVGSVVDVPDDGLIQDAVVTRKGGRTTIEWTATVFAGSTDKDWDWRRPTGIIANVQVMWAIGSVGDDAGCQAPVQYHGSLRSLANVGFPLGRGECAADLPDATDENTPESMLETDSEVMV
eukprot:TRINITY_DN37336_c0_g1_i1.p1 TRINITY_DN37336_c0_g1~~TRINITY_DN37336_c0_g1_i1.p1  ORF type:complete len:501 (-),score=36.88 TRINITY_DN37336_c0_g1_i1:328-1665(-)